MADESGGLLRRSASSASSQTETDSSIDSEWTLLNAQGTEIDTCAVQTELHSDDDASETSSFSFPDLQLESKQESGKLSEASGVSVVVPTCGRPCSSCNDLDVTLDADGASQSSVEMGEEAKEAELRESVVEDSELMSRVFLPPGYTLDRRKLARLLDALSENVDNSQSTDAASYCDDLPVNFVQMCGERIRNYMHTTNAKLNWKLSLLLIISTALVLGLGIGHFIGTTHNWLKRHRLAKQQVEQLKLLQDHLVTCIHDRDKAQEKYAAEVGRLEHEVARYRQSGRHCGIEEKPHHPELELCKSKLNVCQYDLERAESEIVRKAATGRWALNRLRRIQEESVNDRQRAAESSRSRHLLRRALAFNSALKVALAVQRNQTANLKIKIASASDTEAALLAKGAVLEQENESMKSTIVKLLEEKYQENRASGSEEAQRSCRAEEWLSPANLSEFLVRFAQLPASAAQLANQTRQLLFSQLKTINEAFGDVGSQFSKGVETAERLAQHLTEDLFHSAQEVWEKAQKTQGTHWNIVDKMARFGEDLFNNVPDEMQHAWSSLMENFRTESNFDEDDEWNKDETPGDGDGVEKELPTETKNNKETEMKETFNSLRDTSPMDATKQIDEFRYALRRSGLEEELGGYWAESYLNQLKFHGKRQGLGPSGLLWWLCQRLWWLSSELDENCLSELSPWQRPPALLEDLDTFVRANPLLEAAMHSWTKEPPSSRDDSWRMETGRMREKLREENERAEWVFERRRNREQRRKEEAAADWMWQRAKQRERQRKQHHTPTQKIHQNYPKKKSNTPKLNSCDFF